MEETLKQRVSWQRIKQIFPCSTVIFLLFMGLGFAMWWWFFLRFSFGFGFFC